MTDPRGRSTKQKSSERQRRRLAVKAAKEADKHDDDMEVHHKDGNRNNNDPSNLKMVPKGSHGRKHGRGHKKPTK